MHYLPNRNNSGTLMFLAINLINLLGSLLIIAWNSTRNSGIFFLSERSKWGFREAIPSFFPTDLSSSFRILYTVIRLIPKLSEIFVLELPVHATQYSRFSTFFESELPHVATFLTDNAQMTHVCWFGLVGWVLWHINLCRLFNAKSIFM